MPTDYDLARYLKKKGYNPEQELDLAQLRKGYAQNFDWEEGFKPSGVEFASYLKQKGYQPDTPGIEKIVKKESWQDIHQDFRDDKVVDAETLHHTQEKKLREEYGEKPRLSDGTIEKIKKFKHNKLTFEQESLIDKLILSKELNERYKKKRIMQEMPTAQIQPRLIGNPTIDKFIQEQQLKATDLNGYIKNWNAKNNKWQRYKDDSKGVVVLKNLHNSQDITTDFLQEVAYHKLTDNDVGVNRKDAEFCRQYEEIVRAGGFKRTSPSKISKLSYKTHPQAIYTNKTSELNTQLIKVKELAKEINTIEEQKNS
ncbi:3253_t:CDS:2 [Entrophospora sp. SA101]|nr:3253_t:CDS:2 [Entrophospora sp. SA101]